MPATVALARRGLLAMVLALPALAAQARVNAEGGGVAIRGTDPVAYHLEGRPVPGRPPKLTAEQARRDVVLVLEKEQVGHAQRAR